jgi:hypothetical protein
MITYTCADHCEASLRESNEVFWKESGETITFSVVVKTYTEFADRRMAKVCRAVLD